MYCKHCGAKLDDDAMFCEHCGTPVTRIDPAQSENKPEKKEISGINKTDKKYRQELQENKGKELNLSTVIALGIQLLILIMLFIPGMFKQRYMQVGNNVLDYTLGGWTERWTRLISFWSKNMNFSTLTQILLWLTIISVCAALIIYMMDLMGKGRRSNLRWTFVFSVIELVLFIILAVFTHTSKGEMGSYNSYYSYSISFLFPVVIALMLALICLTQSFYENNSLLDILKDALNAKRSRSEVESIDVSESIEKQEIDSEASISEKRVNENTVQIESDQDSEQGSSSEPFEEDSQQENKLDKKRTHMVFIMIAGVIVVIIIAAILILNFMSKENKDDQSDIIINGQYEEIKNEDSTEKAYAVAAGGPEDNDESKDLWIDHPANPQVIAAGTYNTIAVKADGTVVSVGDDKYGESNVAAWTDIVSVTVGDLHCVGLKSDGTVVSTGVNDYGQCDVYDWSDIVSVSAGIGQTIGLKSDGTVVSVGNNEYGEGDISGWSGIIAVSTRDIHTVGLKADGTVIATGSNDDGQCNVYGWSDIVSISTGASHTIGLKKDGTVKATGSNEYGQCDVDAWSDIIAVSAGGWHTVGLKKDGTVVATGYNGFGQCDVSRWRDIVAISAGAYHTVGVKSDGTVVAIGRNDDEQCHVSGWKDIKVVK